MGGPDFDVSPPFTCMGAVYSNWSDRKIKIDRNSTPTGGTFWGIPAVAPPCTGPSVEVEQQRTRS